MKHSDGDKITRYGVWNALGTGVSAAILTVSLASAWTLAQEAPQIPGVSAEEPKRLDLMKSKGPEALLTILPVRLGGQPMAKTTDGMSEFRDRITEFVGLLLEQKGLKNIELGKTAFEPAAGTDMTTLAASLAECVNQHPITTEYVLYAELRADGLRAVVAEKTGDLVWSDELTARDEPFKKGAPEPMVVCVALVDRLAPQLGLNAETAKAAKPGKIAAIMAERSGIPPDSETAPMPGRQAEMKKAMPAATLVVFSPRVRVAANAAESASADSLAKAINGAGLGKAAPAKQSLLLKAPQKDPNEMKVLWDLAREFRDYVKKNPVDADYVLYADYRFNPQHWEQGFVHLVVCDRKGDWVLAELANSHHAGYQSIKPISRDGCDKILVKMLKGHLK
jgi:hypothetical protein